MAHSPRSRHDLPKALIWSGALLPLYFAFASVLRPLHPAALAVLGLHLLLQGICVCWATAAIFRAIRRTPASSLWLLPLVPVVGVLVLTALLPPTAADALIQHLAVPRWWMEADALIEIPWHEWSYYPMVLNLPFIAFLKGGLEPLAPLYHGSYLVAAAGVLGVTPGPELGADEEPAPYLAPLLLLLFPVCLKLAGSPLVDLGLSLFCLLGLHYLIDPARDRCAPIRAGIALGLALSTKYNGLLAVPFVLAAGLVGGRSSERGFTALVRENLIAAVTALIVFSPWLARNVSLTGNPVFPLYKSVFGPATPGAPSVRAPGPLMHRVLVYGESLPELLLLPIRVLTSGEDNVPRAFDGRLSPLVVFAIGALLLAAHRVVRAHAIFVLAYLPLALLYSIARVRYLAPIYPSLALLTSLGARAIAGRIGNLRRLPVMLLGVQLVLAITYLFGLAERRLLVPYLTGALTREEYLERSLDDYRIIGAVNRSLRPTDRVYLLHTPNHFYYYDVPLYSFGHFSGAQIVSWLGAEADGKALRRRFAELGITHLVVHAERTKELFSTLDPARVAIWDEFVARYLRLDRNEPPYSLWTLAAEDS
jgi:hypothetical protein